MSYQDDNAALEALLAEDEVLQKLAKAEMKESMAAWKAAQLEKTRPGPLTPGNTAIPQERSETGLAARFAELYRSRLRYVPAWGWTVWDERVWNRGALELARKASLDYTDAVIMEAYDNAAQSPNDTLAAETLKWATRIRTAKTIRAILEMSQALLLAEPTQFDQDPWLLNTQGGLVDLKTGEVKPHDADAMCSMICDADPTIPGDSERWGDFLRAVTCDDPELQRYLQVLLGMAAVGKVYQEGIAIFFGGGSNGKSTLCNPISAVLGSYAATIAPEALMATRFREEVRGLAGLRGKRLVLASETEEGQRLSSSVVKRLASTDKITARELYKEAFDYTPTHTLIMFTNFLPRIGGTDNGIWRRIHAVPFNAQFGKILGSEKEGIQAVPNYGDVLIQEDGHTILRWVIEGASMFHKNGNRLPAVPAIVREATGAYRTGEDWIGNFISERCELGDRFSAQGGQLYAAYRHWAEANGEYVRRNRDFAAALESAGFSKRLVHNRAYWMGLKILPDEGGYGLYA